MTILRGKATVANQIQYAVMFPARLLIRLGDHTLFFTNPKEAMKAIKNFVKPQQQKRPTPPNQYPGENPASGVLIEDSEYM